MEETLEILQDNLGQALIDTAYMVVVSATATNACVEKAESKPNA